MVVFAEIVGGDSHLGVVGGVVVGVDVVVMDVVVDVVVVGEVFEGEAIGIVPGWRGSGVVWRGYSVVVHCWAVREAEAETRAVGLGGVWTGGADSMQQR